MDKGPGQASGASAFGEQRIRLAPAHRPLRKGAHKERPYSTLSDGGGNRKGLLPLPLNPKSSAAYWSGSIAMTS